MEKFIIQKDDEKISSINRTIRLKAQCYDKLLEAEEKYNISFNKLVNQCVEYALENLEK